VSENSRQNLWLAAWVIGFAVAMSCMLLAFKHRAAFDSLQRERLHLVAAGIDETIERNLTFGMGFGGIEALPEVLAAARRSDSLIDSIDVIDATGTIAYSTDAVRKGRRVDGAVRDSMNRAKGDAWHAVEGSDAAEASVVRNAFGLTLGHVVVRYRLDGLIEASRAFTRRLAAWGLAIAILGTGVLFFLLRLLHDRLELRLALIRRAFAGRSYGELRPGSLRFEAAAARAKIDEAHRLLLAAEGVLEEGARKR
jgi:hypothetical protein